MEKTEFNSNTHFNTPPILEDQLLGISDDCLMVQHRGIKVGLNFAFGGVLTFLFMGIPMFIFLSLLPWLEPYGYKRDGSIATFADRVAGFNWFGYFIIVAIVAIVIIGITYLYPLIVRKAVSKNISPITFNRQAQTVSAVFHKKEVTLPWSDVKGSIYTRTTLGPGMIPMSREVLELDGLGQLEGNESLWEYIRIFMQEGADRLKITPFISDSWDHEPFYSRTFKQGIDHHWPWPIQKNPALAMWISILIWPIKIVMFIPFVLTEWWWRRMMKKAYKKSNNFPEQRFKDCAGQRITGQMATQVAKAESDMNGINYLEVKRRLKANKYN